MVKINESVYSRKEPIMSKTTENDYQAKIVWKYLLFFAIACFAGQGVRMGLFTLWGTSTVPEFWTYVGVAILIIGIADSAIEEYMGLPFFYGQSQRSGSNANSFVVCAIGIAVIAKNFLETIAIMIVVAIVLGAERFLIGKQRVEKINRYIGKEGIAETNIDYKGKGKFGSESVKVRVKKDNISAGTPIRIEEIDGFNLIVKKLL